MAALDFMALLKEEKRKAHEAASSKNRISSNSSSNVSAKTSLPALLASRDLPSKTIDFPSYSLTPRPKVDLDDLIVGPVPSISYVRDFVSSSEATAICAMIEAVPEDHPRWAQLRGRRLQCWGGTPPRASSAVESTLMAPPSVQEPLPAWLSTLRGALVEAGVFPGSAAPNHVLINRYENGEGILGHTDGPLYEPRTATLSLSMRYAKSSSSEEATDGDKLDESKSPPTQPLGAVMTFQRRQPTSEVGIVPGPPVACEVALLDRSLVVFADAAYTDHMHAIADQSGCSNDATMEVVAAPPPHSAGVFDTVGGCAPLANAEATGLKSGDVLWRPAVRYSLTFRHFIHLDGPQVD